MGRTTGCTRCSQSAKTTRACPVDDENQGARAEDEQPDFILRPRPCLTHAVTLATTLAICAMPRVGKRVNTVRSASSRAAT
ncbi:MAG: hypothetical protein ABW220_07495, partial [Burkholderiaceae bacterium]